MSLMDEPPVKRKRGRPPKPKHDPQQIATKVRAAFLAGLVEVCKREKKAMHEVFADWIQNDPKGTFGMVSQFFPKESKVDVGETLGAYLLKLEREQRQGLGANIKSVSGEVINGKVERITGNKEEIGDDPD